MKKKKGEEIFIIILKKKLLLCNPWLIETYIMFNLRGCTLGQCLTDTIDEMDQQGLVTSQLRDQILQQFDKVHYFFYKEFIYYNKNQY